MARPSSLCGLRKKQKQTKKRPAVRPPHDHKDALQHQSAAERLIFFYVFQSHSLKLHHAPLKGQERECACTFVLSALLCVDQVAALRSVPSENVDTSQHAVIGGHFIPYY